MPNIVQPSPMESIVDADGLMFQAFRDWAQDITGLDLIIGTGSPEGVVDARVGREYMDKTGITGSIKYIKRDSDIGGDRSQGWILV